MSWYIMLLTFQMEQVALVEEYAYKSMIECQAVVNFMTRQNFSKMPGVKIDCINSEARAKVDPNIPVIIQKDPK